MIPVASKETIGQRWMLVNMHCSHHAQMKIIVEIVEKGIKVVQVCESSIFCTRPGTIWKEVSACAKGCWRLLPEQDAPASC
jgi:hypothetical protein